jgi:hypothetical protein
MQPESPLPRLQEPSTGPCSQPNQLINWYTFSKSLKNVGGTLIFDNCRNKSISFRKKLVGNWIVRNSWISCTPFWRLRKIKSKINKIVILCVTLHGCETWSVIRRVACWLRVFGKRAGQNAWRGEGRLRHTSLLGRIHEVWFGGPYNKHMRKEVRTKWLLRKLERDYWKDKGIDGR